MADRVQLVRVECSLVLCRFSCFLAILSLVGFVIDWFDSKRQIDVINEYE